MEPGGSGIARVGGGRAHCQSWEALTNFVVLSRRLPNLFRWDGRFIRHLNARGNGAHVAGIKGAFGCEEYNRVTATIGGAPAFVGTARANGRLFFRCVCLPIYARRKVAAKGNLVRQVCGHIQARMVRCFLRGPEPSRDDASRRGNVCPVTIGAFLNPFQDNGVPIPSGEGNRAQVILRLSGRDPVNLSNVRLNANAAVGDRHPSTAVLRPFDRVRGRLTAFIPSRTNLRHRQRVCHVRCYAHGLRRLKGVLWRTHSNSLSYRAFCQAARVRIGRVKVNALCRGPNYFHCQFQFFPMGLGNREALVLACCRLFRAAIRRARRDVNHCGFKVSRDHARPLTWRARACINRVLR